MANLNIKNFVSATFGVATETIVSTGTVLKEVSTSTSNVAKIATSISGGALAESESFFQTRAIELSADTELATLKANMKLNAVKKIAKDPEALTKVESAVFSQILAEFEDI